MAGPPGRGSVPKDVVLEFLERVTAGDDAAFELVAPDFVQHAAGPQGRDGLRQTAAVLDHDLGPGRLAIQHAVAEGDLVVVHLQLEGRHRGSTMPLLAGIPVTGRPVSWAFIHVFRVTDGLLAEHWACRDDLGLLAQLGVASRPQLRA